MTPSPDFHLGRTILRESLPRDSLWKQSSVLCLYNTCNISFNAGLDQALRRKTEVRKPILNFCFILKLLCVFRNKSLTGDAEFLTNRDGVPSWISHLQGAEMWPEIFISCIIYALAQEGSTSGLTLWRPQPLPSQNDRRKIMKILDAKLEALQYRYPYAISLCDVFKRYLCAIPLCNSLV